MITLERLALPDVTIACALAQREPESQGPLVIAAHGFPDDASTFLVESHSRRPSDPVRSPRDEHAKAGDTLHHGTSPLSTPRD